ncbi:Bicarbonate transport ATP-binding protein CmpD [Achromobacter mucicolens]|uniref:ABC transporter ATP-binding protein n=1 Tax=Achromobacter mucicolens TaxID=1389922 RepID=UPI0009CDDF1E|nr:ABC transporter ATP-binding protein [Achromobacter mucicolens]MDG9971787.1 ABC transporter ATP-binding protein [Achromobacter mucicolens]OXC92312.1 ABC transporter [Achromobacter sp. KAs 3-5]CAB3640598.1 Bicarbonate transport ATP-binding protein CmpD [Achromobacter mucicolens]
MTAVPVLQARAVSVSYQTRRGSIDALRDVDLAVDEGEFVTILGPSGCGKSTLLKLAAGLLAPTRGHVEVGGAVVTGPSRDIGVAFQKPTLLPWRTVLDNVLLPSETAGERGADAERRARELLDLVGLRDFAGNYPNELSGGMQQRVGLARMLQRDPRLLLMDEPFAALDAMTREALTLELQRIWMRDRKSVLFITHSIAEAVMLSDRVLVMSARPGRVVEDFRVDIPRPRSMATLAEPAFTAAADHLRRHFIG